jgi:uroporphyrin-III C-methyltransferase / precorrin-2 dehydrogenase / sirohydrochlorin ferrochelatase
MTRGNTTQTSGSAAGADATAQGPARGWVSFVGSGPGDPGLLTVRARELIAQADVVLHDRLIPPGALDGARADAELVDVGKQGGGPQVPQAQTDALLVDYGRRFEVVVRLKGGDPFVFGRGMEEVEACVAAGVPVEVVPGVTSAIGVPGLAGIPVTHRGLTHEFVVVSGHVPPGHPQSLVDWPALGRLRGTLVVLMGVDTAPAIAAALIEHGRAPATPVAVIADGSTPRQRTVRTTLSGLAATLAAEGIRPPAVWVVGDVVALRSDRPVPVAEDTAPEPDDD